MIPTQQLKVKIFADSADIKGVLQLNQNPLIKGFTTNPTLMRNAGISNYESFAKEMLSIIKDKPISFEVFSDDFPDMRRQALKIATWGPNVYVKIPVTNTKSEKAYDLIRELAQQNVKLNVTAIMTMDQVRDVSAAIGKNTHAFISVFAGRIADTGRDPIPMMSAAMEMIRMYPNQELLWASPRELLNIIQADQVGCHVITVTNDILKKLTNVGKCLNEFSLDTVKMFYRDAQAAEFVL